MPWCAAEKIAELDHLDRRALDRFTSPMLTGNGIAGKPLSRVSVHSYARTVSQFLRWCAQEGEKVPARPQLPKLPRRMLTVLSRDEVAKLEEAVPAERDKLIIRVLADTGMRVGALCGLRVADLVYRDRKAYFHVRGKGSWCPALPNRRRSRSGCTPTCSGTPSPPMPCAAA